MNFKTIVLAILVVIFSIVEAQVQSFIHAKWSHTSVFAETSEFLADLSEKRFWNFIAVISKKPAFETDKDAYDFLKAPEVSHLINENELKLLDLSLGLREFSPAVAFYSALGDNVLNSTAVSCSDFVLINDELICDLEKLKQTLDHQKTFLSIPVVEKEHVFPTGNSAAPTISAVLYGDVTKPSFHKLLLYLFEYTESQKEEESFLFSFRHFIPESKEKIRLSGYGIELVIKNMEYKVVDDREMKEYQESAALEEDGDWEDDVDLDIEGFMMGTLKDRFPDSSEKLDKLKKHLIQSAEIKPVKEWEIQDLGIQSTSKIVKSNNGLFVLKDLSQNLPTRASSIVKQKLDKSVVEEVEKNKELLNENGINTDEGSLILNGQKFTDFDPFKISHFLRSDISLVNDLSSLGLDIESIQKLIFAQDPYISSETENEKQSRVDMRFDGTLYLNDLEKDQLYHSWPSSLDNLKRQLPRGLGNFRKNIVTVIYVLDPLAPSLPALLHLLTRFHQMQAPLRVGFLFYSSRAPNTFSVTDFGTKTDGSKHSLQSGDAVRERLEIALIRLIIYISEKKSVASAIAYLSKIHELMAGQISNLNHKILRSSINPFAGSLSKEKYKEIARTEEKGNIYLEKQQAMDSFIASRGNVYQTFFVNGKPNANLKAEGMDRLLFQSAREDIEVLHGDLKRNLIDVKVNVPDYFMDKPEVVQFSEDTSSNTAPITVSTLAEEYEALNYINAKKCEMNTCLTYVAISDLSTIGGLRTVYELVNFLTSGIKDRGAFISNHKTCDESCQTLVRVTTAFFKLNAKVDKFLLQEFGDFYGKLIADSLENIDSPIAEALENLFEKNSQLKDAFDAISFSEVETTRCQNDGIVPETNGLIIQGKYFEAKNYGYGYKDFESFYTHFSVFTENVKETIPDEFHSSKMLNKLVSILKNKIGDRIVLPEGLVLEKSGLKIPGNGGVSITAIVNPLSKAAQKIGPILQDLKDSLTAKITLILMPIEKLSELPLSRFYRYSLQTSPRFTKDGKVLGPAPSFSELPQKPLLTLSLDVPDSWDVSAVESIYDLDNIHLESINGEIVRAIFELSYLLVEGHCYDTANFPPRGLQFNIGTSQNPAIHDTLVMANYGYFQLKASAGLWDLSLRTGRSSELYSFSNGESSISVPLRSFEGAIIHVKVVKNPDRIDEELLVEEDEAAEEDSIWSSISNYMEGSQDTKEVINVFSIASGHLYERFMSIMILSVMKNTKNPVKFWLFGDSMSPRFKKFLPVMAQEYGFDYAFVTYKWPSWLRAQTEKQRIIWGYKILFLDVLFPLHVKRVIFVDADQIVRADLNELIEMDLKGAPYGYTPFCGDRKEMDRFRFWTTGYWKNHLQSLPYHISALYVIDLVRFRQLAAGDRLRGSYQQLSADPGSLANLDQDLPNNLQHQLKIFSLPQEWLWCETWCSDKSKKKAKTIDLCNNPLTKEPKLKAAVRIVSEWDSYDIEVKQLHEKIAQEAQQGEEKPHVEL